MKLNRNSISAKLFRYFYSTDIMPGSLCTYFWALVLAYILIIPLEIGGLLGTLTRFIFPPFRDTPNNPAMKFFLSIVCITCLVLFTFCLIPVLQFYKGFNFGKQDIIGSSIIDIIFLIFVIVCYFGNTNRKFLPIEYAKSKIKGVCPRIDWDN